MVTDTLSFTNVLREKNISFTDGVRFVRVPSPGKDAKNRSCSIDKSSGRVYDFVNNESISFETYMELMGEPVNNLKISFEEQAVDDTPTRIIRAQKLWTSSAQVTKFSSPVYKYLSNRGLPDNEIEWLIKYDLVREFNDTKGKIAVVMPIKAEGWGETITGVQRIYITKNGEKDESNGPAKKMFGVHGTGGLVIPADSTIGNKNDRVILAIVEGPETGAAVHAALTLEGRLRCEVFVAYDTGGVKKGLKAVDLYAIKTFKQAIDVIIFQDHDLPVPVMSKDGSVQKMKPAPGQLAADQLTEKLRSSGWTVKSADPPPIQPGGDHKRDWLDVYIRNPQEIRDKVYELFPKYKLSHEINSGALEKSSYFFNDRDRT